MLEVIADIRDPVEEADECEVNIGISNFHAYKCTIPEL
jgi:hypothetical protein